MEVWLIRNGEKSGPFHDYEIRQKISTGDIAPEVPSWHEGLAGWLPISQVELFKKEFDSKPALPKIPEPTLEISEPTTRFSPPPLPQTPKIGRRFWARWLDINLYCAVWWLAMWAAGRDIEACLSNAWIMIPQLVPWFILEAFLIHRYGTTLGKSLLGLSVENQDGSKLSLPLSTRRSLRVLVAGIGFGFSFVAIICQVLSLITTIRIGKPLWDHLGNHRVASKPIGPARIISVVVLFMIAVQLQMAVLAPFYTKIAVEAFPELKPQLEANPPWHLPQRYKAPPVVK